VKFAFPLWQTPAVPIAGEETYYPVRRIYCVGRNYAEHTREMGFDPNREPPFFFSKPPDAIVPGGGTIPYALGTGNLAYEMELVVAIGKQGVDIAPERALEHIYGYAAGLDMTRRDLQLAARDKGRPWDPGKGFDQSAPISAIHPAAKIGHPKTGRIWFKLNDEIKQDADLSQMIWPVPDIVAFLSKLFVLRPGDLIYTGTPAGVGPVKPGDRLHGGIDGVDEIALTIAS
jgi:fumarylpyruvate hydrolase